ncbi:hypothetical protein [Solicola gregarius]|uniref:DUF2567 domain-containing protein n=1 Tax=Solicola gregarius TaxID=2908642 RepID=A0AA46TIA5_9ACTN|nr:hypothetical protein [Solicola gregarius]UYM05342.1 hypothetical protein L0C25_22990 [Solicola gregarius]
MTTSKAAERTSTPRRTPSWEGAVAVTAIVFLVLGGVAGLLWSQLAHPPEYTVYQGHVGYFSSEAEFRHEFDVDLTYAWLGAAAALVGGVAVGWRYWGLGWAITVLVVVGSAVGAFIEWLGALLGPESVDAATEGAAVGDTFTGPIELGAWSIVLLWPVMALIGVIVSVWLRAPRDEFVADSYGYGFDTDPAEPSQSS